ncbi:hypothetical protein F5Y15DRAFT_413221 [Xylariaceae sp. FL0016]|nr:hypothetical protein F5Y15DRAFT_413221 [Xylariaceae sp. FL0016]
MDEKPSGLKNNQWEYGGEIKTHPLDPAFEAENAKARGHGFEEDFHVPEEEQEERRKNYRENYRFEKARDKLYKAKEDSELKSIFGRPYRPEGCLEWDRHFSNFIVGKGDSVWPFYDKVVIDWQFKGLACAAMNRPRGLTYYIDVDCSDRSIDLSDETKKRFEEALRTTIDTLRKNIDFDKWRHPVALALKQDKIHYSPRYVWDDNKETWEFATEDWKTTEISEKETKQWRGEFEPKFPGSSLQY